MQSALSYAFLVNEQTEKDFSAQRYDTITLNLLFHMLSPQAHASQLGMNVIFHELRISRVAAVDVSTRCLSGTKRSKTERREFKRNCNIMDSGGRKIERDALYVIISNRDLFTPTGLFQCEKTLINEVRWLVYDTQYFFFIWRARLTISTLI